VISAQEQQFSDDDTQFMRLAIEQARNATLHGDVPIGAVVVAGEKVIATGCNERELLQDPTAHAEVLALRRAAEAVGSWRVLDATLYVTLEPCTMCAGAIVLSRIPRVVFGASDPKAGACGSLLDVTGDARLNHRPDVRGGLLEDACGNLLREFFAARR
jgi:tRNA(adenine34) deaminase